MYFVSNSFIEMKLQINIAILERLLTASAHSS